MTDESNGARKFLTGLFECAIVAADPMKVVAEHLPPRPKGRLFVIGAGKASARMAEAVEAHYGPCEGLVITRGGYGRPCAGIEIVEASHPIPDARGVEATRRMLGLVQNLGPDDLVIALISGGGSSLLCAPLEGLTLDDIMAVNKTLLESGAPISEMNVIRKKLSAVKGGQLAAACHPAHVLNLIISDVPGDDPALIASGPTVADTSIAHPMEIVEKYDLKLSPSVMRVLLNPTLIPRLTNTETHIIATPTKSLSAAGETAMYAGYEVRILDDALEGEAGDLGAEHARFALELQSAMNTGAASVILLSGGECTVTHSGEGVGGPNAEYVLSAALALNGAEGIHVLACDTDGVDGTAEVAGAYAGPNTLKLAQAVGVSVKEALKCHDSHTFFKTVGGQIVTGPTLTYINDFRAILIST